MTTRTRSSKINKPNNYIGRICTLASLFCAVTLPSFTLANFGNLYELKANETVLYEEEGYVEISVGS